MSKRKTGDFPVPNCGNCKHWDSHIKLTQSKPCRKIVPLGEGDAHIFTNSFGDEKYDIVVLMTKADFSCSLHEDIEIPY